MHVAFYISRRRMPVSDPRRLWKPPRIFLWERDDIFLILLRVLTVEPCRIRGGMVLI